MNLEGKAIFEKAAELEGLGVPFMMCSIVKTEGSTPRKTGTHLICTAKGETWGTVGGGTVEHRCILQITEWLADGGTAGGEGQQPGQNRVPYSDRLRTFNMHSEDNEGMVCGGKTTVFFWQAPEGCGDFFRNMLNCYEREEPAFLVLDFEDEPRVFSEHALPERYHSFKAGGSGGHPQDLLGQAEFYLEPLKDLEQAYLIGGGHVGQALAPLLETIGFRVTVVDDRDFVQTPGLFPEDVQVICCPYEELMEKVSIGRKDYVVVTTFGHKGDLETLRHVLPQKPRYLGCIGSKKKAAYIAERLQQLGFAKEETDSIHSPVGLSIGAETPQEIAVSIAAEIIAVRRGVPET